MKKFKIKILEHPVDDKNINMFFDNAEISCKIEITQDFILVEIDGNKTEKNIKELVEFIDSEFDEEILNGTESMNFDKDEFFEFETNDIGIDYEFL